MTAITLLDGSIGQELVKRKGAAPTPLWSTSVMLESPALVREVHDAYFAAGATVASTNTYAVHENRLERAGMADQQRTLISAACDMAAAARDGNGFGRVAGCFGPFLATYRPDLDPDPAMAAPKFRAMAEMMGDAVDLYLVETVSSLREAEGALAGLCGLGKPVWIAFSVRDDDGTSLRSGEPLASVLPLLDRFAVEAVLLNCSPPEAIEAGLAVLAGQPRPFGAYANGFKSVEPLKPGTTVDQLEHRSELTPARYTEYVMSWIKQGASIVGGCCEISPAHMSAIHDRLLKDGYSVVALC